MKLSASISRHIGNCTYWKYTSRSGEKQDGEHFHAHISCRPPIDCGLSKYGSMNFTDEGRGHENMTFYDRVKGSGGSKI